MSSQQIDIDFMKEALKWAHKASEQDEVPVGAVITCDGELIAGAHNLKEARQCALGHAELLVIEQASKKLGRWRLSDCCLYVALEPCSMCAGALVQARIGRIVIGAMDPKTGSCGSVLDITNHPALNHQPEVLSGVCGEECSALLKDFFKAKRKS